MGTHVVIGSTQIYKTYLKYVSPADIYPYSIDEDFIGGTG